MQFIPFDDRPGYIWVNGEFVRWKDASVHILNHGLHYGSCVFEGIRVYNGKIFKLKQHVDRLFLSAKILDLTIKFSKREISKSIELSVEKQKVKDGYIRPVVWRGSEIMAISASKASVNIAIAAWTWPSYFSPDKILEGITMSYAKWTRPSPNSAPVQSKAAGLYMICSLSKHAAEKDGFDDALMLDYRGYIAEATGANIFFIKKKTLYTPIADCFLNGITRQTVLEIAHELGLNIVEKYIKPSFLKNCDEVFLTGTAVEITPVKSIEKIIFKKRDITKLLIKRFKEIVEG